MLLQLSRNLVRSERESVGADRLSSRCNPAAGSRHLGLCVARCCLSRRFRTAILRSCADSRCAVASGLFLARLFRWN